MRGGGNCDVSVRSKREFGLRGRQVACGRHDERRLCRVVAVGNQACEQVDDEVDDAAVAGVLDLTDMLELLDDGLNQVALAQPERIAGQDQPAPHVLAGVGDQAHAPFLEQPCDQIAVDVALVGVERAVQPLRVGTQARSSVSPGVSWQAKSTPRWLTTRCNLKPKNQPTEVLPRRARPAKTLCWLQRVGLQTAKGVESTNDSPVHSPRLLLR